MMIMMIMINIIHYYFLRSGKTIIAEKYYIKIRIKHKNFRVK